MGLAHTHKSESFAATAVKEKTSGLMKAAIKAPRYYQHFLNSQTKEGDQLTITITNKRPKRTVAQNNYYWGVYLPLIAEQHYGEVTRNIIDTLHKRFVEEFLYRGKHMAFGKEVVLLKSTSELGVGEFCEYILNIEKLTGIEAPPTENFGLVSLKEGTKKKKV